MERHQHVVVKKIPSGAGLGICFSQTRASHNKPDGFGRECPTFRDEMISAASYCFQIFSSVNIEQQECCVKFCIFRGLFGHFCTLTRFSRHFMCIIQIWTTCTCSNAYKLVENSNMSLGCMLRSHARNGNECQTPCHRHSAANIEIPGF